MESLMTPHTVNAADQIRALPDVSTTEPASVQQALDWVGMRGIDVPVWLDDPLMEAPQVARADVLVNLPDPQVKGIHMSRLYGLVSKAAENRLSPAQAIVLLDDAIASHESCGSNAARFIWHTDVMRRVAALVTDGLTGWTNSRLTIDAKRAGLSVELWATVEVTYSSTCPCSASLARQLVEERFRSQHAGQDVLSVDEVADWIRAHGTLATPHSQRSVARVRVLVDPASTWNIGRLIHLAESALGTVSQGPVKRADEQEFALRNGQNLMFVEDAARILLARMKSVYARGAVEVTHLESLHPHDAYARVEWGDGHG